MVEDRDKETLDANNCKKLVGRVQMAFRDRQIAEEVTWQVLVLIPKGGGNVWLIGLVGFLCKMVAVILNRRFGVAITIHDVIHGF